MAINKERRQKLVAQYVDILQQARGLVVTEYRGMTMKQMDELRGKLRDNNARFIITKNTLLKIALREVGWAADDTMLAGPVALIVAFDDLPNTIKLVLEYAGTNEIMVLKGGVVGNSVVKSGQLDALSKLPSLDVLRAQLLGMVTMPLTQFIGLLDEPGRQVVAVIQAATDGLVNVLATYTQKEAA